MGVDETFTSMDPESSLVCHLEARLTDGDVRFTMLPDWEVKGRISLS